MTLSLETLGILTGFFAVVGPGMYFMGRLSTRVEAIEKSQAVIFRKLDALAEALMNATRTGAMPALHCPLAENERCAFRNSQMKEGQ